MCYVLGALSLSLSLSLPSQSLHARADNWQVLWSLLYVKQSNSRSKEILRLSRTTIIHYRVDSIVTLRQTSRLQLKLTLHAETYFSIFDLRLNFLDCIFPYVISTKTVQAIACHAQLTFIWSR